MNFQKFTILSFLFLSCSTPQKNNCKLESKKTSSPEHPTLIILGNVQDGGSPHIGCEKKCCIELFNNPDKNRMVVSLGIVDPTEKKSWIIEATPCLLYTSPSPRD